MGGGTLLTARGADRRQEHSDFSGVLDLLSPESSQERAPVEIRISHTALCQIRRYCCSSDRAKMGLAASVEGTLIFAHGLGK